MGLFIIIGLTNAFMRGRSIPVANACIRASSTSPACFAKLPKPKMDGAHDGTATEPRFTLLSAFAVQTEIEELLLRFKRQQGVDVEVNYDLNPTVAKRVVDGEAFDVGMTNPWYVDEMVSLGRIAPDVHVPFGRIPLAIGAAGSHPKQIVSSHEALRTLLLNASSIAYTSSGTSGKTFLKALESVQWVRPSRLSRRGEDKCSMP
jgi:Bacterial extracellular solute-binding protein